MGPGADWGSKVALDFLAQSGPPHHKPTSLLELFLTPLTIIQILHNTEIKMH